MSKKAKIITTVVSSITALVLAAIGVFVYIIHRDDEDLF